MRKIILYGIAVILIAATSIFVYAKFVPSQFTETDLGQGSESLCRYYGLTIDGCEYITATRYSSGGQAITMVHKGNCSNPIHKK